MNSIKTILVATDFGEPGERALTYAVDLARWLGAKVVLLHAFELPVVGFPDGAMLASAEIASRITNAAQKALDEAVANVRRDGKIEITTLLEQGDPREVVLAMAKETEANLIVMGTHGRKGIARALIGSVTESVVRVSPIPVLTVHAATKPAAA
jgi:nucleotide-binding universal stress UspA family protein